MSSEESKPSCCEPTLGAMLRAMEWEKAKGHLRAMACTCACCGQAEKADLLQGKIDEFEKCLCDCDCC